MCKGDSLSRLLLLADIEVLPIRLANLCLDWCKSRIAYLGNSSTETSSKLKAVFLNVICYADLEGGPDTTPASVEGYLECPSMLQNNPNGPGE
jgi:hypothetical protein